MVITKPKALSAFTESLVEAGAELLGKTNPYEVLRFRTIHGVGVIYTGKRGETWNPEAIAARDHLTAKKGSLSPVLVTGRNNSRAKLNALLTRDGDGCFFCAAPLEGRATIEHLVSKAHGGPNHISNMYLACPPCNDKAGHLSAPKKVRMAIAARSSNKIGTCDE